MCGINGYTHSDKFFINKMNDATRHRGPDGAGVFSDENITFGHNLLAITETPVHAKQPWVSADERYAMVYNGEIYNHDFLRKELEKEGEKFQGRGDTEVIFRGLVRHGTDFIKKLDGMFAIGFYDRDSSRLLLFRDRSGMKPLYYSESDGKLVFSSELRGLFAYGIEPILDKDAARSFFLFGYTPERNTLIHGVRKVLPGYIVSYDLSKKILSESSFGWNDRESKEKYIKQNVSDLVGESVERHTMGLRPFGLFLSGGLDSTVILHELVRQGRTHVKTYTTRFATKDSLYNQDADLAARLADDYSIDHHDVLITEKDFIEHYEDAILAMEEPRYNPSVPAYWLLAKEAAKDITVVLNGSGGDEIFLGYPKYLHAKSILEKYHKYPEILLDAFYSFQAARRGMIPYKSMIHPKRALDLWAFINNITPLSSHPGFLFLDGFGMPMFLNDIKAANIPPLSPELFDTTNAVAELDRYFWLANEEFMRTDKIAMHFGLEGRFPFLANNLLRLANNVSSLEKLKHGKKTLLREAYQGKLPDYILTKGKTGWNAPVTEWMGSRFGDFAQEVLSDAYYPPTAKLFNLAVIREMVHSKTNFQKRDLMEFLPIVQFQVWAKAFRVRVP